MHEYRYVIRSYSDMSFSAKCGYEDTSIYKKIKFSNLEGRIKFPSSLGSLQFKTKKSWQKFRGQVDKVAQQARSRTAGGWRLCTSCLRRILRHHVEPNLRARSSPEVSHGCSLCSLVPVRAPLLTNSELEGKFGELNSQSDTGHNHFEVFQMIRIVALGC